MAIYLITFCGDQKKKLQKLRKNCVFVDALFQERIDTFPLKKSKSKKKIFYIGKKYFSFSKSVSQLVFWNFNGDGDSNLFPGEIRK